MLSCPECGTEVAEDSQSCPECGSGLGADAGDRDEVSPNEGVKPTTVSNEPPDDDGVDTKRAIAAGVMGTIVGAIVAFALSNFGGEPIWFVITLAGVGYFLYSTQETVKLVVGMGLYLTALCLPLVPIVIYILTLLEPSNPKNPFFASLWIGLYSTIFAFIGTILGLTLAGIGYFIRKGEGG